MPRRIDQIKIVDMSVARLVAQRGRLRLDGDATLTLNIHGVEHLRFHLAVRQAAAQLNNAVRQGGLAVVYMGDDGKIADILHRFILF